MVTKPGWINTPALGPPGEGYNQLTIGTDYLSELAVTEPKLSAEVAAKLNLSDAALLSAVEALLLEVEQLRDVVLLALS